MISCSRASRTRLAAVLQIEIGGQRPGDQAFQFGIVKLRPPAGEIGLAGLRHAERRVLGGEGRPASAYPASDNPGPTVQPAQHSGRRK